MNIEKITEKTAALLAAALTLFQIYTALYMPLPGMAQRAVHLGLGLAIVYLYYPKKRPEKKSLKTLSYLAGFICAVIALTACFNVVFHWGEMAKPMRLAIPWQSDRIFGVLLVCLVLWGTKKVTGWAMPLIAVFFLCYAYFGQYMPGMFKHAGVKFGNLISMSYMCTEGIFSSILGVSTDQVFIFLLFGQLLESLGGSEFFLDWANSGFGKLRGGPAKVSIFGSALFGSISGSAVANVVGTGTITIPLMKKVGYDSAYAGAVESVASTGGLIMPPVMGAAAFIMADIVGITYWQVCLAALIPAILYYLALFITVHLRAKALDLRGIPEEELPDGKKLLKEKGYIYLPPLIVLIVVLGVFQYPAYRACIYCCILLLALSMTKKELRQVMKREWFHILVKTAKSSMTVIMACSCAGLILMSLQTSGLILKLSNILIAMAGGRLWLLMILVMIGSLIMGMGLPASACYIILAILAAPSLVALGVPTIAAHLFVLYFGAMSAITPPVAMAAFAAAPIAEEGAAKIGFTAFKMALPAFLIAFCFGFQPELVMIGTWYGIAFAFVNCVLGVAAMSIGIQGYFQTKLSPVYRGTWVLCGVLLILPQLPLTIAGYLIGAALCVLERKNMAVMKANS
ncbi:MAG: TRAP transporter fused permease subunit [Hungatella sp.]|nr:TRAP transporter fused permease subunit [Hungatella sp.]